MADNQVVENNNHNNTHDEESEVVELESELLEFLGKILTDAQKSVSNHLKHLREIATKFKENGGRYLVFHLAPFIDGVLLRFKTDTTVDRVIDFFVKIATYRDNGTEWIDSVTTSLIEYCLTKENAKNKAVRFRVCDIVGKLLKNMDETYELDEDLWERLEVILLRRLTDKIPQVRQRAAFAIHRLSDPSLEDDAVRAGLINMMDHDSNKECRREALKSLDLSKKTIKSILRRCRDTSDDVRKCGYERLHQVDIRALSIRQRVDLLKSGLTERSEVVKKECKKLLTERWLLNNHKSDIIDLLKLLDIESYEEEAEIVLNTVFTEGTSLTVDPPPYINESQLDSEHLFYWRCLIEYYSKQKPYPMQQEIDDCMPDTVEFVKLFESLSSNEMNKDNTYIIQQLLILARYLNIQDEFSRSQLSKVAIKLLKSYNIVNDLIPLIMKLLRKLHNNDEDEYTRLIAETVSDIRDPIEDENENENLNDNNLSIMQKARKEEILQQKLKQLKKQKEGIKKLQKSNLLKKKFSEDDAGDDNISVNDGDNTESWKIKLHEIQNEIKSVITEIEEIETKTTQTWIRMLVIITDLIQFTNKDWEHPMIKPMFETIIVPTVIEKRPIVRAAGLKAFSLFLQMDKTNTQNNLILFLHILSGDGPASEYFALQALFDFLMIFDLFDDDKENNNNPNPDNNDDEKKDVEQATDGNVNNIDDDEQTDELNLTAPKSNRDLITVLKTFLEHEDEELLVCAVEGFTKLLFMNRLKHFKLDILTRLLLLYFDPMTEENEYIRQILSVFFPYYVNPTTFPNNRQYIAHCLMPSIRICSYAPKENSLSQINVTKLTEYILWLINSDPITQNMSSNRNQQEIEEKIEKDTLLIHEQLSYDILFEINAHPESDQVRALTRIVSMLQLNQSNLLSLNEYKVLTDRLLNGTNKITHKPSIKYLDKFLNKIQKIDITNELDEQQLNDLEEKRKNRVKQIQKEHLIYLDDEEKDQLEQEFASIDREENENDEISVSTQDTQRKKQLRTKNVAISTEPSDLMMDDVNDSDNTTNTNISKKATQRRRKKPQQGQKKKKKIPTRRVVKKKNNDNQNDDDEESEIDVRPSKRGKGRGRGSRGKARGKGRGKAKRGRGRGRGQAINTRRKRASSADEDEMNQGTQRKRRKISKTSTTNKNRNKQTESESDDVDMQNGENEQPQPRRRSTRLSKKNGRGGASVRGRGRGKRGGAKGRSRRTLPSDDDNNEDAINIAPKRRSARIAKRNSDNSDTDKTVNKRGRGRGKGRRGRGRGRGGKGRGKTKSNRTTNRRNKSKRKVPTDESDNDENKNNINNRRQRRRQPKRTTVLSDNSSDNENDGAILNLRRSRRVRKQAPITEKPIIDSTDLGESDDSSLAALLNETEEKFEQRRKQSINDTALNAEIDALLESSGDSDE